MDTNQPPANDTPPQPVERPPFNEVSVLFPLLTIYTAGYMALMIADFVLKGGFDLQQSVVCRPSSVVCLHRLSVTQSGPCRSGSGR